MTITPQRRTPTSILDSLVDQSPPAPAVANSAYPQPGGQAKPGEISGYRANIGAGLKRGVAYGAGMVLGDPLWGAIAGPVDNGPGKPLGMATPVGDFLNNLVNVKEPIVAGSRGQQLAGQLAEGAGGAAATGGPTALNAAVGAGGAIGGSLLAQPMPDWAKPYADLLGNLGGSLATGGAAQMGAKGGRFIARKAGEMGSGESPAKIAALGGELNEAAGPEGKTNIERAFSTEQEAQQLEKTIADPNAHPDEKDQAQQRLNDIQKLRVNVVPGSQPTTAQLAQTPAMSGLEQSAKMVDEPAFTQRMKDQNNAQVAHLQALEPTGADSGTFGQHVASQLSRLDALGKIDVANKQQQTGQQPAANAGQQPLGVYGGQMREAAQGAAAPWQQNARRLWTAVDPDKTWAIKADPLLQSATDLKQTISPSASINPDILKIIDRAAASAPVIKFADLGEMRADANAVIKKSGHTLSDNENRLIQGIKSGIDQTIAASIDEKSALDPSLQARLQGLLGGREPQQPSPGGGHPEPLSAPSVGGDAGAGGNAGAPATGPRGGGGDRGVSPVAATEAGTAGPELTPKPALAPNVTPENVAGYQAAVAGTREMKQMTATGGVGQTLRRGANFQEFHLPEGKVPGQIFTRGPTEPAEVAHFISLVGLEQATPLARDVLANELRSRNVINPADGTINAQKLAEWRAARQGTLSQFPELDHEFGNLQTAQQAFDQASAAHLQRLKAFQDSAAAKFIGTEPNIAVRRALATDNPEQTLRQLMQAAHADPEVEASVKRAFVDHLITATQTAAPSGDNVNMLSSAAFRKYADRFRGALQPVFGGQGVQNIEMVAADMRRQAEQPKPIAGSQTAPNYMRAQQHGIGEHVKGGAFTTALALLGEHMADALSSHMIAPAIGVAAGVGGKILWSSLRQSGIETRQQLLAKAMLDPAFAKAAMEKADARGQISVMTARRIAAALQASVAADIARGQRQQ